MSVYSFYKSRWIIIQRMLYKLYLGQKFLDLYVTFYTYIHELIFVACLYIGMSAQISPVLCIA